MLRLNRSSFSIWFRIEYKLKLKTHSFIFKLILEFIFKLKLFISSVVSSTRTVGLLGDIADHFVWNHSGSSLRSPTSRQSYKPEWKIRGSLWRSSANSKKALSGFTALRKFDQRGMPLPARTMSRLIVSSLIDPYKWNMSKPISPATTPEKRPAVLMEQPLKLMTGRVSLRVA